jgi:hypothetical protein
LTGIGGWWNLEAPAGCEQTRINETRSRRHLHIHIELCEQWPVVFAPDVIPSDIGEALAHSN